MPKQKRKRLTKHEALRLESERALEDQIRRNLALPMDRRTNFLRKRISYLASCL
jgi:hypothetical protein